MGLYLHLTLASVKMIARNRQALAWALAFPIAMVVLFAVIGSFNLNPEDLRSVGVTGQGGQYSPLPEDAPAYGNFMATMLPGITLWGIMSYSIIGIAVAIATYREKRIFRRIKVSPMSVGVFFAAQVTAYLALSLVQAALMLGIGSALMGVSIAGNLLIIGLLALACNVVFLNLGFIVGAFSQTPAAASGLGNLIVLPLAMLSGVFFPMELLPDALAATMRYLPLVPMVETLRGVALNGDSALGYPLELGLIAVWFALTAVIAARVFKFE